VAVASTRRCMQFMTACVGTSWQARDRMRPSDDEAPVGGRKKQSTLSKMAPLALTATQTRKSGGGRGSGGGGGGSSGEGSDWAPGSGGGRRKAAPKRNARGATAGTQASALNADLVVGLVVPVRPSLTRGASCASRTTGP